MVSALALNRVSFGSPLLAKSGSFSVVAYRAITLLTILTVERMSVLAQLLHSVLGSSTIAIYERVFSCSDLPKMSRSDAVSVLTDMVHYIAVFNVASVYIERYTVRASALFTEIERTVAVLIERTLPQLTISVLRPFTVKPSEFVLSNSFHMPIVPYTPYGSKGGVNG